MSVLIKGMEMPANCESCPCKTTDAFGGLGCQATGYIPLRKANQDRPDNCPLIPVPPHGDLIDRKTLLADTTDMLHSMMVFGGARVYTSDAIKNAPTIIPAEEGE